MMVFDGLKNMKRIEKINKKIYNLKAEVSNEEDNGCVL